MRLASVRAFVGAAFIFVAAQVAASQIWVGTWASAQQVPEPQNALPAGDLNDTTLREAIHVSAGGSQIRVHVSNEFGTTPLHLTSVHIARPKVSGSSTIDVASDRALLFDGRPDVTVPPGAEYISDPCTYALAPLSDLTISMHIDSTPGQETGHPGSRQTTFYAHGDLTAAADMPAARKVDHWYLLSGVDVNSPAQAYAIVALGDSITDGHGSTTNGNDRWTDAFAKRLQANPGTRQASVLNLGIGGNHLLTDGLGPNVLARFDRDVLAQPGVRYLILLEGINDIGGLGLEKDATPAAHEELVHRILGAYNQIIVRAHAHGITVFGATILPDGGSTYYHPDAASERDRQRVNAWIREPGHFDAVIDLDKVTADPSDPLQLLPAFDSGDHLHPGPAGYEAIGQAIPLSAFR